MNTENRWIHSLSAAARKNGEGELYGLQVIPEQVDVAEEINRAKKLYACHRETEHYQRQRTSTLSLALLRKSMLFFVLLALGCYVGLRMEEGDRITCSDS